MNEFQKRIVLNWFECFKFTFKNLLKSVPSKDISQLKKGFKLIPNKGRSHKN